MNDNCRLCDNPVMIADDLCAVHSELASAERPSQVVVLPVVCTGRDGRTWPAHVYAWNPDRIWVCLECKEPRP